LLSIDKIVCSERFSIQRNAVKQIRYGCSNTSLILSIQDQEIGLKAVRFWILQFFQCTLASYVVGWSPDVML